MTDDLTPQVPPTPPATAQVPPSTAATAALPATPDGAGGADGADGADAELLGLIDRLAELLDRSDLTEIEMEAGGTSLILRKPGSALQVPAAASAEAGAAAPTIGGVPAVGAESSAPVGDPGPPPRPSVKAPLTGIFYASPAPGSAPYVQVGGEVAVGQVIGLIEAMKLFNEIKSDLAGRVVRVVHESGTLVKAKGALIEVEPL